ncbi:hypothetical protein BT96DRAFT_1010985 [Gymnopus androsaceus JB14]|uniref:Uncharacterized protein n=1 Tax=Gymnopus androsaceus JB14 TaxID=1447944 RepID=A0A6A4G9X0_9AGAR|nr:hypothetical protein BT96DRAFT_1010985 [Gymnopus androsaceus JB14]
MERLAPSFSPLSLQTNVPAATHLSQFRDVFISLGTHRNHSVRTSGTSLCYSAHFYPICAIFNGAGSSFSQCQLSRNA